MNYVYILQSLTTSEYYVGITTDIERRLTEHNQKYSRYTKSRGPWKLVYSEEKKSLSEAQNREKFLKTGDGRKVIKNLLKNNLNLGGWCNGSTPDSGSGNQGSSPCPPAMTYNR